MLLPMTEINTYKKETLKDEYAPFLAAKIIDPKQRNKIQEWIRNLPPETLAKLFECLIKRQSERSDNELQVKGIINIMALINPTGNDNINDKCRQFEETLFRMNTNIETKQSALAQWNNFGQNWLKIARFIKDYSEVAQKGLFDSICTTLCKNMEIRKKISHFVGIETQDYICFYKKSKHEKIKNNLFNDAMNGAYLPMVWSVYEI